jgi:two-component system sensor kinase FixL
VESKPGEDEFDAFGRSAEDLVRTLEEYKAKFERKTRLEQLGLIVGQVSHDLKAPFNEAENFLNAMPLLLKSATHEELLEGTTSLAKRIRSGKESINQAIQFAKRSTVAREDVSLAEVFRSVQARTLLNTKLKGVSLALTVPGEYRVLGDQIQLETAFVNLLENSADEKLNAKIELEVTLQSLNTARITYTDNGSGIPEEFLEKVFEPLVTYKTGGTGFGLSSVRETFSVHGGSIRALPHRGGAKFEILIPILGGANA